MAGLLLRGLGHMLMRDVLLRSLGGLGIVGKARALVDNGLDALPVLMIPAMFAPLWCCAAVARRYTPSEHAG